MNSIQNSNSLYGTIYITFVVKGRPGLYNHYVEKLSIQLYIIQVV